MAYILKLYLYNIQFIKMKYLVNILFASILVIVFSQCSSAQRLQESPSFNIEEVYSQKWIAGVQGGGSGINVFLKLKDKNHNVVFDSIYFRGRAVKLEINQDNNYCVGRFVTPFNQMQDIVLSDKPNAEFGNEAPIIPKKIRFKLKDDECVISFKENNIIEYFKIEKIKDKQMVSYPSPPPPNKQ